MKWTKKTKEKKGQIQNCSLNTRNGLCHYSPLCIFTLKYIWTTLNIENWVCVYSTRAIIDKNQQEDDIKCSDERGHKVGAHGATGEDGSESGLPAYEQKQTRTQNEPGINANILS